MESKNPSSSPTTLTKSEALKSYDTWKADFNREWEEGRLGVYLNPRNMNHPGALTIHPTKYELDIQFMGYVYIGEF